MIRIIVEKECIVKALRHSSSSKNDVCLLQESIKHQLCVAKTMTALRAANFNNGARKDVRITI